jgi:alkylation response protein AidB-like acyl-CoA dehydrogenase
VVTPSAGADRGPRGYADDSSVSSKIFTIFEGTSEIQRMIIGRSLTGLNVR